MEYGETKLVQVSKYPLGMKDQRNETKINKVAPVQVAVDPGNLGSEEKSQGSLSAEF